jgi:hypothetical protein
LLTATPHRGKEHFFRGFFHLLDAELYPWDPDEDRYDATLRPSRLSFLGWINGELKHPNGEGLFPARYAETVPVPLGELELAAYEAVMEYASSWYGKDSTLALSIYGKRAASSLVAAPAVPAHWPGPRWAGAASLRAVIPEALAPTWLARWPSGGAARGAGRAPLLVMRDRDSLDDAADRDTGALVELPDDGGRWSFVYREDHLLAGDEDGGDVAEARSLAVHLFHHASAPFEGFEKQLARHARPVTLDQVRGHAGPPF